MAESKSLEKTRNIGHLNNFLGQKTRKLAIVPVSVNSDPRTRPTALTCQFIEKLIGRFILQILTPFQRRYSNIYVPFNFFAIIGVSRKRAAQLFFRWQIRNLWKKTRNFGHLNNFLGQKTRMLAIVPVSVTSDPQTRSTALTCPFLEKLFGRFILQNFDAFSKMY